MIRWDQDHCHNKVHYTHINDILTSMDNYVRGMLGVPLLDMVYVSSSELLGGFMTNDPQISVLHATAGQRMGVLPFYCMHNIYVYNFTSKINYSCKPRLTLLHIFRMCVLALT